MNPAATAKMPATMAKGETLVFRGTACGDSGALDWLNILTIGASSLSESSSILSVAQVFARSIDEVWFGCEGDHCVRIHAYLLRR